MIINPIGKKATLADEAYAEIRDAIVFNKFAPGIVLTEERLASMLQISRTPIRSALNRLENDGLIEHTENGICVSTFSYKDTNDIAIARGAVESLVIEQLDGKITDQLIEQLTAIVNSQDLIPLTSPKDYIDYIDADAMFHIALATQTGNRYLIDMERHVITHASRCLILSSTLDYSHKVAIAEHRAIISELEARDCKKAALKMRDHVSKVASRLLTCE